MLVGRARETATIAALVSAARRGTSGVLVVVGEAGIGKSSLLGEARASVGPDVLVLTATGSVPERDLPFAGLAQLLRPLTDGIDGLPRVQADALAQALALRTGTGTRAEAGERFAIAAATLGLITAAAETRPVLVIVDDLHHLDRPSVDAVLFAARRLHTDAVAMLVATRPDAGVDGMVADLPTLTLAGLSAEDCEALVPAVSLTAPELRRLHDVSGGNPLAVLEIAGNPRVLASDVVDVPVPRLIEQAFAGHLSSLSTASRTALVVAALGGDVGLATLARAVAAVGATLDDLDEARSLGAVTIDGDRVAFGHPLLRASVVQAAGPALRRQVHHALFEAIDPGDLDRRALHLSAATLGPDDQTAAVLEAAARSAAERRAYAVAATWGEQAARASAKPSDRARRLVMAGEHAWLGGLADRALQIFGEAATAAPTGQDRQRAQALRGVVSARCGSLVEARDLLLRVAADLADDDPGGAVLLLAEAVYACVYLCDPSGARSAVAMLETLRQRTDDRRSRVLGDLAAGIGRVMVGEGDVGTQQIRRSVAAADDGVLLDDPRWRAWVLLGPMWLRESGETRAVMEESVHDARAQAAAGTLPFLLFHAARDDAATDRWTSAEGAYREAISLARESGQRTDETMARVGLAWLLARRGREQEMRAEASRALEQCRRSQLNFGRAWLLFAWGDLAAGAGRYAEAVGRYRALASLTHRLGVEDADLSPAPELVDCLVRAGDLETARAEASAFERLAARKGQPWAQARAHRALALAGDDAQGHIQAALELHERSPDAYEQARTQLAAGSLLRRDRRRTQARAHLREALATFDRLGAAPWAAQASAELAATGERVQRRGAGAEQPLTSQELQVARILGGGTTTREAAAALFLSPKTVEYHLRHVYIKLGIASRAELAERLAEDPELR